MAKLIRCPDCKQTMAKSDTACPWCGRPVSKQAAWRRVVFSPRGLVAICLIIVALAIVAFYQSYVHSR